MNSQLPNDWQLRHPRDDASAAAVRLEQLIDTLSFGDFHERWDAAKEISKVGDIAIPDLIALAQDQDLDPDGRWFAIRSLGHFDDPEVISTLISLLAQTDDDELWSAVGEALTQIGTTAVMALVGVLHSPPHRLVAVQALSRIHHPAALSPLLQVVNDADATVRTMAVEALTRAGDHEILPILHQALNDPASTVRLAAIRGLISLKPRLDPQTLTTWLQPRLWDVHLGVAQQTIYTLGRLDHDMATAALLSLMSTSTTPQPLQIAVVQALGWQATPTALQGLIETWAMADTEVRLAIIRAIEMLANPTLRPLARGVLLEWLDQVPQTAANSRLRCRLVLALGEIGDSQVERCLRSHLTDPDPGVKLHAEAALQRLHHHLKPDNCEDFSNC